MIVPTDFELIEVGEIILVEYPIEGIYRQVVVSEIDETDRSIVSDTIGGLNIYPNEDDQYLVVGRV